MFDDSPYGDLDQSYLTVDNMLGKMKRLARREAKKLQRRKEKALQRRAVKPLRKAPKKTQQEIYQEYTHQRALHEQQENLAGKKMGDSDVYSSGITLEQNTLPRDLEGNEIPVMNGIKIPEDILLESIKRIEEQTKIYTQNMLNSAVPNLLGYNHAANLTQAALAAMGIDADVDITLTEALKQISRMDVIFKSVASTRLPHPIKLRMLERFSDNLVDAATAKMISEENNAHKQKQFKELQGYVVSRRDSAKQAQTEQLREFSSKTRPDPRTETETHFITNEEIQQRRDPAQRAAMAVRKGRR